MNLRKKIMNLNVKKKKSFIFPLHFLLTVLSKVKLSSRKYLALRELIFFCYIDFSMAHFYKRNIKICGKFWTKIYEPAI